jgi:hypothetical protein
MFRQNRRKLNIINWDGGEVKPPQGSFTLYWWKKGWDPHFYYKGDLHGLDGEIVACSLLNDTYEGLVMEAKELIGIK